MGITPNSLLRDPGAPRSEDRRFAQPLLALTFTVLGIKAGKLLVTYWDSNALPLRDLLASWSLRVLVAGTIAYLLARFLYPRWRWLAAGIVSLMVLAAGTANSLLKGRGLWSCIDQFRDELLFLMGIFRRDMLFLAGATVVLCAAAVWMPVRYRSMFRTLWLVGLAMLLLVSGLDLAHYSLTGLSGTGRLLSYFLNNAASLWSMAHQDLNGLTVLLFAAPVITALLGAGLAKRWERSEPSPTFALGTSFVLFATLLAANPQIPDHRYDQLLENTYLSLADVIPWDGPGEYQAMEKARELPLLFDTSRATLTPAPVLGATPKNVIVILLESARANATSVYNPPLDSTPFLADFAKRGAVVSDMYAVLPATYAAWTSVLYGIVPVAMEEFPAWVEQRQQRQSSLPKLLAGRGYSSAFITSARVNYLNDAQAIKNAGFETIRDGDSLPAEGFESPSQWGLEDRAFVQPALSWVQTQRDLNKPFFLTLLTSTSHFDYKLPSHWQAEQFRSGDASYDNYLNCLKYTDSAVKELIEGLENLGVLKSSIVVILGDHGESFGEHGPRIHTLVIYEETIRIPAVVYAEGLIAPGTRIPGLRQEIDIEPTILDLLHLREDDAVLPGLSMLRPAPDDRTLFYSDNLNAQFLAMRKGSLKFIFKFGRLPTEAYDLSRDPGERKDIATSLPRATIEGAEMEMMVWRERISRASSANVAAPRH